MKRIVLAAIVAMTQNPPTTPPPQQQSGYDAEAARREAERVAREKAEAEARKKQSQDRLDEFNKMRPPTPAERAAEHRRMYPDFVKNLRKLDADGREFTDYARRSELDSSTEKAIHKKAKSLEDRTEMILNYIMFDATPPNPPKMTFNDKPLLDRVRLVSPMLRSIGDKTNKWASNRRRSTLDVNQVSSLIAELQTFKLLVHSLRQ